MVAKKNIFIPKKTRPSMGDFIAATVAASRDRSGTSLPALKKGLFGRGYVPKNKGHVKVAVKRMVAKGALNQVRGTSASRSFKMTNKFDQFKKGARKHKGAKKRKTASAKKKTPKKSKKRAAPKRRKKTAKRRKRATKKSRTTKTRKTRGRRGGKRRSRKTGRKKK